MRFLSSYFNWLQKGNPAGKPDRLPELTNKFETSVPGVYCIGDLTGIPLIKLAAESGYEVIEKLAEDKPFIQARQANTNTDMLDVLIAGAGPAGIAAGIHAQKLGLKFKIIESSQTFNTLINYPAGKPIHVTPKEVPAKSALVFSDGTKETLLKELTGEAGKADLPLIQGEMVREIVREDNGFSVKTAKATYRTLRVIIAIGKSGNARMLGVPGEKLSKVFTRLVDPGEHKNKDILVVGGGDSALEAANALAEAGNRVTVSYRKPQFSRPKEHNLAAFEKHVKQKRITPMFKSNVKEIREKEVVINSEDGEKTIANDVVYALIGTEIPIRFFNRSNIRMEGEKNVTDYVKFAALLLFASVLYFGKSAPVIKAGSLIDFLTLPVDMLNLKWSYLLKAFLAWISFIGMTGAGVYLAVHIITNVKSYFSGLWQSFKHSYYIAMYFFFAFIYLSYNLQGYYPGGWVPWKWYAAMYSLTIVVFGFRRMFVNPTGYIKRQTLSLMAIQVFPLFLFPIVILPFLGNHGYLGNWIMAHVFPDNSYWRSFGFVLAWPLSIYNLASDQAVLFWLIFSIVQTFIVIPYIVYRWGKGAYCGWVCSCGALAETLGDEYRTKAPHGPAAKKWENAGQFVLWFAAVVTLLVIAKTWFGISVPLTQTLKDIYSVLIDIVFAGVLGVGVYFFMSGRVWCRFLCPLAALMHIYARFSLYRIFSDKKSCISCNICTKVCHMGIDVMGYSSRGIPMNDVQCVRCSTCIVSCPMDVLTFGSLEKPDPDNKEYKTRSFPAARGWQSGLSENSLKTPGRGKEE